ncbi:MAG: hypothetical protein ACK4Z4_03085 [Ferrovibrio sp.]|nr:hypothetical protein [Alphaproteobacteria bacterium]
MSKNDKDLVETESAADLATESAVAGNGAQEAQALPLTAAQPDHTPSQAEQSQQSQQFNSWLDRALPRLMDYLGSDTTAAVTSPSPKAKH